MLKMLNITQKVILTIALAILLVVTLLAASDKIDMNLAGTIELIVLFVIGFNTFALAVVELVHNIRKYLIKWDIEQYHQNK